MHGQVMKKSICFNMFGDCGLFRTRGAHTKSSLEDYLLVELVEGFIIGTFCLRVDKLNGPRYEWKEMVACTV